MFRLRRIILRLVWIKWSKQVRVKFFTRLGPLSQQIEAGASICWPASPRSAGRARFHASTLSPADCGLGVDAFLHFEGASDQADLRLGFSYDLHNIEPKWNLRAIEQAEPLFGGSNDACPFAPSNRFMRPPEKLICPRFHFDKDQDLFFAITADEVNLTAAAGSEISIEDLKRLFL
jgi:hypothetical protein